jgi:hypothetical protein
MERTEETRRAICQSRDGKGLFEVHFECYRVVQFSMLKSGRFSEFSRQIQATLARQTKNFSVSFHVTALDEDGAGANTNPSSSDVSIKSERPPQHPNFFSKSHFLPEVSKTPSMPTVFTWDHGSQLRKP